MLTAGCITSGQNEEKKTINTIKPTNTPVETERYTLIEKEPLEISLIGYSPVADNHDTKLYIELINVEQGVFLRDATIKVSQTNSSTGKSVILGQTKISVEYPTEIKISKSQKMRVILANAEIGKDFWGKKIAPSTADITVEYYSPESK